MIYETQEQLDASLAYWQKVLRLQDWRIEASVSRMRDFNQPERRGEIVRFPNSKAASIKLLDPLDFKDIEGYGCAINHPQDHEQVLVHELLHIHEAQIADIVEDANQKLAERLLTLREQMVECLSRAFIEIDRRSRIAVLLSTEWASVDPVGDPKAKFMAKCPRCLKYVEFDPVSRLIARHDMDDTSPAKVTCLASGETIESEAQRRKPGDLITVINSEGHVTNEFTEMYEKAKRATL